MEELRKKNSMNKSSKEYGSEYQMRVTNRRLLNNKFQSSSVGYLYILEFPGSIKVGFSKDYKGRTNYLGGDIVSIISGPTNDLADIEFDIMIKFIDFTILDSTGSRYTEFIEKSVKSEVLKFVDDKVRSSRSLKYVK